MTMPAMVRARVRHDSIRLEALTDSIGAELDDQDLGDAGRDPGFSPGPRAAETQPRRALIPGASHGDTE